MGGREGLIDTAVKTAETGSVDIVCTLYVKYVDKFDILFIELAFKLILS